jgi:hypothetical protein
VPFRQCPHCGSWHFLPGPTAGLSENVECEGCGARFNVAYLPGGPFLDREIRPPDPEKLRVRLEVTNAVAKAFRAAGRRR